MSRRIVKGRRAVTVMQSGRAQPVEPVQSITVDLSQAVSLSYPDPRIKNEIRAIMPDGTTVLLVLTNRETAIQVLSLCEDYAYNPAHSAPDEDATDA